MAEQSSTAETERDGRDSVPLRRRKAGRSVPDVDERGADEASEDVELSPEKVLELITTQLTVGVEIAGAALGLGRNSSYKACESGEITSFKIGGKVVVPTAPLRQKLGLEPPLPGAPATQIAAHSSKQEMKKSPQLQRRRR